jgi:hypothetical protein
MLAAVVFLARRESLASRSLYPAKEFMMRLTSALIKRTLTQFEAEAIPESHPVIPQLKGLFGDHTFFLDEKGLNIVEPADPMQEDSPMGQVVNIASWSDSDPKKLAPHEPELTEVVVVLESTH